MDSEILHVSAKIWLYPGKAGWYFVTIAKDDSDTLKDQYMWPRRGFGAIPVEVTVGQTTWKTSIFPEKSGTYLLPIKKSVRNAESIVEGSTISVSLKVLND